MYSKHILAGWPNGLGRTKKLILILLFLVRVNIPQLFSSPTAPVFRGFFGSQGAILRGFAGVSATLQTASCHPKPAEYIPTDVSCPIPGHRNPENTFVMRAVFLDGRSLGHLYITPWAVVAVLSCFRRDRPGRDQNQLRVARTSIVLRNELNRCHPADNSILS